MEAGLLAGLLAAAIAGAPFAAHAASQAAYESALQVQHEQQATRQVEQAVLVTAAPSTAAYAAANAYVLVPAKWKSATGVPGSGELPAPAGSAKGTKIPVEVDNATGQLTSEPLDAAQVAGQGDAAMVGTIAGLVVLYTAGAAAIRTVTNRRRMAAWDADWLVTSRTWHPLS